MSNFRDSPPILVFGATGGIGYHTAKFLKKEGMNLILSSSRKNKNSISVSHELSSPLISFDFNKNANIDFLDKKIKKITSALSGLVISIARPFPKKFIHNTDVSILREQLDIHIIALHHIIKTCMPFLENAKKFNPRIVYISTEYLIGNPPIKIGPYLASKSAAQMYMKVLSNEILKKNIKVFILSSGMIRSKLTEDLPEAYIKEVESKYPMKRLTEVNEIANTILGIYKGYLDASYGQDIQVSVAERR